MKNTKEIFWQCKYCGENEIPSCHKCVREDGKLVSDELVTQRRPLDNKIKRN